LQWDGIKNLIDPSPDVHVFPLFVSTTDYSTLRLQYRCDQQKWI